MFLRYLCYSILILIIQLSPAIAKKKEAPKSWSVSTSYKVSADLLQNKESRRYSHNWSIGGGYKFNELNSVSAFLSAGYFSIVNSIPTERNFEIKYLGASYEHIFKIKELGVGHKLIGEISLSVPVSEVSSLEGIRSYFETSLGLVSTVQKGWTVSNGLSATYVWNRYDFSPESGESQTLYSGAYSLSTTYGVKKFSFILGTGIRARTRIDGLSTAETRSFVSMGYSYQNYSLGLSYGNGSYVDAEVVELVFVDRFRQLVKLSLSASF